MSREDAGACSQGWSRKTAIRLASTERKPYLGYQKETSAEKGFLKRLAVTF